MNQHDPSRLDAEQRPLRMFPWDVAQLDHHTLQQQTIQ